MASAGTAYVDVEAKLDSFASDIDAAVSAIDTQTVTVEADVAQAQSDIDSLEVSDVVVGVEADTGVAEGEIDSLEGQPVVVPVEANTEQAQANIDELGASLGSMADAAGAGGGQFGGLISQVGGLAGLSSGATAGMGALAGGFILVGNAAADAQAVTAQTDSILGSLGSSAVTTAGHMADLSQRVMEYSGFSDEAVQSGANTLLMMDNIRSQEVFDRAVEGAADLAVKMGTEVPQAARMLGMALQDPEKGMGRLRRAGIFLTDQQQEMVAGFMATGDVAAAQEVILDSLEGRIGNLAEDYGSTAKGGMDKAREAMDELAETAGTSLLPIMEALSETIVAQAGLWQQWDANLGGILLSGPLQAMFGARSEIQAVGEVVGDLPPALYDVEGGASAAAGATDEFADAAGRSKDEVDGLSGVLRSYLDGTFLLPQAQRELRDAFDELFGVLLTEGHTAGDVEAALEDVGYATADVAAATGDTSTAVDGTVYALAVLKNQTGDADGQIQGLIDTLLGVPDDTSPEVSAPGATEAKGQVGDLDTGLKGLPDNTYVGVHTTGTATARTEVALFKQQLDMLPKNVYVGIQTTGSAPVRRASGGPVLSGSEYLVGEEGPELFVPRTSGTIIPAPQTAAMAGRSATYNVTVNAAGGTDGHELARIISDELRKLERAGQ